MSDSYIRDSQFSGSAIISYGRTGNTRVWLKLLALVAGSFALLVLGAAIWFWFFTRIEIPDQTAVRLLLPAERSMPNNAPVVWREAHQSNASLPTLAGSVYHTDTQSYEPYAVRLNFLRGVFTSERIWQTTSDSRLGTGDLGLGTGGLGSKSPFRVFGWPWALSKQPSLMIDLSQLPLFDDGGSAQILSGSIDYGVWRTDHQLPEDFVDSLTEINSSFDAANLIPIFPSDSLGLLINFFAARGENLDLSDPTMLEWNRNTSGLSVDFKPLDDVLPATPSVIIREPYTLDDGDVVTRIYRNTDFVASSTASTSSESLYLPSDTSDYSQHMATNNNVSCPGTVFARLDATSLSRICSWFDICYHNFESMVLSEDNFKLIICAK